MRVLITGGAGFIGSHLADACLERGDEVVVIDDLSTGSRDNVRHLLNDSRFRFIVDTVQNYSRLAELTDSCDVVFHLAGIVGVKLVIESPVRTIEANLQNTENVLKAASRTGKKVLLTSTSEVYGLSDQVPFSEDGNLVLGPTTKGRWSYGCSKALNEFLALAYWREKTLPTIVARLFNTVGPRQSGRYGMVVPTLVTQAIAGEPLTVYGDGTQTRCFTHVADVVAALLKLVDHEETVGEVFNVGSNEEVSILTLAERIKQLTGSDSAIVSIPYNDAYEAGFQDMPRRVPDISKIAALVGFTPKHDLNDALRHVIAYESARLDSGQPRLVAEASR